jgi:hypothetical protein
VLLIWPGLLPRLTLRLSLLYLPFLRGLRLIERGEIVRRGLDGDRESGLSSECGERVRGRPRDGDREGILQQSCKNAANAFWLPGQCRVTCYIGLRIQDRLANERGYFKSQAKSI